MIEFYKIKSRFGEFSNYKINRKGEILCWNYRRSNITGIIKPYMHTDGYLQVKLVDDNGISHSIKVHTLVADTFIPNPNDYTDINHKDEDKTNNSVENLEWCTRGYNNTYNNKAIKIGLKLRNNERSRALIALDENNNIIYEFPSVREAARFLNKPRADSNIHSGIRKNQKRYGYYWKFKD